MSGIDDDCLVCSTCGTQFSEKIRSNKSICQICLDPRQYIPPSGQSFTTLGEIKTQGYKNEWTTWIEDKDGSGKSLHSIWTSPKLALGQRCFLIQTPKGNVLWDLISYLDDETITKINSLGGISAILISHPHYYSMYVEWARVFKCPVYFSPEDAQWVDRMDVKDVERRWIKGTTEPVIPGITGIKCGGHFDGSLALHWDDFGGILFVADTIFIVPSGRNPSPREHYQVSYSFMYSLPNMIALHPDAIHGIWKAVAPFKYKTTYGSFVNMEVYAGKVRQEDGSLIEETGLEMRLLESMKMNVKAYMGKTEHAIFTETVPA